MIRLEQDKLRAMMPDMPADFAARMENMLRTLPARQEKKSPRPIPFRLILIGALVLALLSTTAYALTRPAVLEWLLARNAPVSPELEQSAQEVTASAAAEGVTVHITGAVYDGEQLAFSYAIENADPTQPVIAALDSQITVNGQSGDIPHPVYTNNVRMVPSPHLDVLPVQRNPVIGGVWAELPAGLQGKAECAVTFIIYRPEKAFAVLISPEDSLLDTTITDASTLAEIADVRATLESFGNAILVEAEETAAETWSAQGYTPVYDWGDPIFDAADARSHLTEVARITVPFTIDADNAIAHDFSGASFQLEGCTAEAVAFRLTPLTTYIHVRLLPTENTEEAARALAAIHGDCALTDETGAPVTYSEMDYLCSPGPHVYCQDGQWVCRYMLDMPGLERFPASVGFTTQAGELFRFDLPH